MLYSNAALFVGFLAAKHISASITVLNINDLLQPNLDSKLFVSTENVPSSPWSHEPYCTTSNSPQHRGQKYCVCTSFTSLPI